MPVITQSDVLIVIFGRVILGVGEGIVVKSGGAIDRIEMLAIWFNRQHRIPIGTFLLAVNVVIINIAAFVFSLEKAMLSWGICHDYYRKTGQNFERIIKEFKMSMTYLYGKG